MVKNKKILFEIAHPKHFYQFKPLIKSLKENNDIQIISREKDVVIELLNFVEFNYIKCGVHGKNMFSKIFFALPLILFDYIKVVKHFNPDIIISRASHYSIFISKLFRAKSIVFPDSDVVPIINYFVGPYADLVISPSSFNLCYGKHHHFINGLFEEAYLSPILYKPESKILSSTGLEKKERYFIVRFVGWNANHDVFKKGFSLKQKYNLIKKLEKYGKVLISSETSLPTDLEKYKLRINPIYIHTVLYYASLYVGDSQTMATEAALLGTPSIRFNSFVGANDMSNFTMLENDYNMMKNLNSYDGLIKTVVKYLDDIDNIKYRQRDLVTNYYDNKDDITHQSLNIISSFLNGEKK